ncbi:Uncharacterised protein [Bordetella pertussis]|nr:Uncharacterised protein [Bordetella pertussis]
MRLLSVRRGEMPRYSVKLRPDTKSSGRPMNRPSTSAGVKPTLSSACTLARTARSSDDRPGDSPMP